MFAMSNPCVTSGSSFVDFLDGSDSVFVDVFFIPNGLFALSNTCVTRGSSFVDDLRVRRCCLRCRIHASPVEAVSLMISESLGAVCALESKPHPWKYFVDDF
jgi:hypothetical protein